MSGNISSQASYDEFTPSSIQKGGCADVSATKIFRRQGLHSCTDGFNGRVDGAVCVPYPENNSQNFVDNSDFAFRTTVTLQPGSGKKGCLTELRFYEKAAPTVQVSRGTPRAVDFPKRYGVRILANGQQIFRKIDFSTTQKFSLERIDLSDAHLCFSGNTTLEVEILAYDFTNTGRENVWEIDDVSLFGGCCTGAATSRNAKLAFSAYQAQRQVGLQWVTNTTYKNDYYVVERSTDGIQFSELARVENLAAHGDLETYQTMDETPQLGNNYYRIKQVYIDGSYDYTELKTIQFHADLENLSMYPNPAQNQLTFNVKPFTGKALSIQIINNFGQVLQTKEIEEVTTQHVELTLDNIVSGFYQVLIQVDNQKPIAKKLMVEKMY
ncbi:MAG: T9SS type A sorting domain-containing protein [Bacteroidota bacterium]